MPKRVQGNDPKALVGEFELRESGVNASYTLSAFHRVLTHVVLSAWLFVSLSNVLPKR